MVDYSVDDAMWNSHNTDDIAPYLDPETAKKLLHRIGGSKLPPQTEEVMVRRLVESNRKEVP